MGEPVKVELARDMIVLSGLQPGKDIEIEFTGIRAGEKLTEELFSDKENFALTKHRRIFVAPDTLSSEQERDAELHDLGRQFGVDLQLLLGFRDELAEVRKPGFEEQPAGAQQSDLRSNRLGRSGNKSAAHARLPFVAKAVMQDASLNN